MRVFRTDVAKLDRAAKRTSAGVLVAPATVARTGVQEYRRADGSVCREWRPPESVFAPEAIESLRSAPVTIGHPPAGVQPHTLEQQTVGIVSDRDPVRAKRDAHEYVDTSVSITRTATQADIESGRLVELSLGYDADVELTPGVTPEGEPYDAIQRNIRINHLALLPAGGARAGREARLRLDGHEDVCHDQEQVPEMSEPKVITKVRVDGVEVVEHSPEHFALVTKQLEAANARATKAEADLASAKADGAKVQAKADGLEVELAKAKQVNVSSLVADELKFRASAAPLLAKDYAFEGKDRAAIKRDAIGAEAVKRVDAQPEAVRGAYLDAAFDLALELKSKAGPSYQPPVQVQQKADAGDLSAISAAMFNEGRKS